MDDLEMGYRAVDAAFGENVTGLRPREALTVQLEAAAPIIVAAELRRIALKQCDSEEPHQIYEMIWRRARELDPEWA